MTSFDRTAGLRCRHLRGLNFDKLLWCYVSPELADGRAMPLKVTTLAKVLDVPKVRVRNALARLTALELLECVTPATAGTPGEYRLGAAAEAPRRTRSEPR